MPPTLTFLHTSPLHIHTFDQLLAELDPTLPVKHIVDETLLEEVRLGGLTPALAQRVESTILEATFAESRVVLCTCSTIGAIAEQINGLTDSLVMRVDRPMAEQAVALGSRLIVAATLTSTLEPTRNLLLTVAENAGKSIEITELLCEVAWTKFKAGDQDGYLTEIAQTLTKNASKGDVIVLAQASMAAAISLCPDLPIPILSSPRLGLVAAIQAFRTGSYG